MQMQVIVSACFSLYTHESNLIAPQPAISLTQQNNHFNLNYRYLQPQQTATSIITRSPFHHQSNDISLNKRPYSPQTFTNHPIFAILFICPQTQNKRAKTRPYVSFSPFMLHKFTQTSAFSICLPNYLTMQTHP